MIAGASQRFYRLRHSRGPGAPPRRHRDAHAVYDHLFADGLVIEVGGWSHCRRYFIKALDSDPDRAKTALSYITALSLLERQLAPLFWSQTLQQPQTQQRLRENLLRGALLSELR